MKDAYWFKHDSNASRTMKLTQIRAIYGLEGLGIFWCIIEVLREQHFYRWSESEINTLSKVINCDEQKLSNFLTDCKRIGLLDFDRGFITSDKLKKDMQIWEKQKRNGSQKRAKQGAKPEPNADKESIGDKSKVKESISETAFSAFHQSYPGIKKYVTTELANFKKTTKDWKEVLHLLLPALQAQIASRQKKDWNPEWKSFGNWISARCWEEVPAVLVEPVSMAEKAKNEGIPYF